MPQQSVILHERLGHWSRQLRPRFQGWPIRWSDTRSARSLQRAAALSPCPIVVIELDSRPSRGLDDLAVTIDSVPGMLSLVIDYDDRIEIATTAREIGATVILGGVVVPPEVDSWVRRWLPLAARRAETAGWSAPIDPEPEPWERLELFLNQGHFDGRRADRFPPTNPTEDHV